MKLSFIIHITLVLLTATYEEGVSFAFPISYDEQSNSFQTSLSIKENGNIRKFVMDINLSSPYTASYENEGADTKNSLEIADKIYTEISLHHETPKELTQNSNGFFGLGIDSNNNNDLLNQLHIDKKIEYKMFSFTQRENQLVIDLGRVSDDKVNNERNSRLQCKMINSDYKCNIEVIGLSGSTVNFPYDKMFFKIDTHAKYINCPIQFLFFLDEYYFDPLVEKEKCSLGLMDDSSYSFSFFEKDTKDIFTLPNIIFNFSSNQIVIFEPSQLFFKNKEGYYEFIFRSPKAEIQKNTDTFYIGYHFLNAMTTIIDIERKEIGLYHPTNVFSDSKDNINFPIYPTKVNSSNINLMKMLCIFILFITLIPVVGFCGIRYKNRKAKTSGMRSIPGITPKTTYASKELEDNFI